MRVQLDQLDPAQLPALPAGLKAEGNGYRVSLSYAPSGAPLDRLAGPASLGLSAPAAPTAVYELVESGWVAVDFTAVAVETGFSSVVALDGPGTFLQAYDPADAAASTAMPSSPAPSAAASPAAAPGVAEPAPRPAPALASDGAGIWRTAAAGLALLALLGLVLLRHHRARP